MSQERLKIEDLSFSYEDQDIIHDICLKVMDKQFVGIIGPNGSGKSTLLKNVYRVLQTKKGHIFLDQVDIQKISYKDMAKTLAVVGQENETPFDFTVEDIVLMGRNPYKKMFDIDRQEDYDIVHHSLEHVGLDKQAHCSYQQLSGGEKQRVLIARALSQESHFYILDEPTNHLDIRYQMQIFDFIKRLKITVLSAIHDLNIASLYCDYLYVMKDGRIVLEGTPEEVLTQKNIEDIFEVANIVMTHPVVDKPLITFLPQYIRKGEKE